MRMGSVGVREAKAQLSRLLTDVKNGGEWLITEHGRPVAVLGPPTRVEDIPLEERLKQLEAMGWIGPPLRGRRGPMPPPLDLDLDLQGALQEDREDRV